MPVDPTQFDKTTKELEGAWKTRVARRGSEYPAVYTIPPGSYELEWAMFGGWPIGRTSRVYGRYSTAKSLLMWYAIRNAQNIHHIYAERFERMIYYAKEAGERGRAKAIAVEAKEFAARFPNGMEAVYYDVEQQFHPDFVKQWGVDIDRLHVVEGQEIEKITEAMERYMGSAHLHIVDSTTAASPIRMLTSDATDEHRSLDAVRWKEGLKRVEHHFDSEENTVILISQTTMDQRTQAERPVGPEKMNFSSSMSLHTRSSKWLYYDSKGVLVDKQTSPETISGLTEPDGIEITARVAKSRVCPPFRTARVRLDLYTGAGFDLGYEISQAAKFYGMVERAGAYIFRLDEEGDRIKPGFQGEAAFREYIHSDPTFRAAVYDRLMDSRDSRAGEIEPPDEAEPEV